MSASLDKNDEALAIRQLLELHDEDFVCRAYDIVLGRPVDADGLKNYLAQIRSGVHKAQIVAELAMSAEARSAGFELGGIRVIIRRHRKRRTTLWRSIIRSLSRGATESLEQQLRAADNHMHRVELAIKEQQAQLNNLTSLLLKEQGRKPSLVSSKSVAALGAESDQVEATLKSVTPAIVKTYNEIRFAIEVSKTP